MLRKTLTNHKRCSVCSYLHGILPLVGLAGWDVEADLHEGDLGVVRLVELQRHLVFAGGALGHVGQRDLEGRVVVDVKR